MTDQYQLFAWNYSYFSAKVRAYMAYKRYSAGLEYEEILATQEIVQGLLIPATGSNVVPQVRSPDGEWLQDSSEIIDALELKFPDSAVVPVTPKQRLVSYLIELLADEWMLPWGFWERWYYSLADVEPNHEAFNALQWGRIYNPDGTGRERMEAARFVFREFMKIDNPEAAEIGPYSGLVQLGVTPESVEAWTQSMKNMLGILEAHFDQHDYVLGGVPTLADFALLGPLYPHLYKDPVPGFMMRTSFPLVSEWIERVNGSEEAGYASYRETRYRLVDGELVAQARGTLIPDDEVPDTLMPLLAVFFTEMWPVLDATLNSVSEFMSSDACSHGMELPAKSFYSPRQFSDLQSGSGPLTIVFELNGVSGVRMASPYQVWMLQRLVRSVFESATAEDHQALTELLSGMDRGKELFSLTNRLSAYPIDKRFEQLYAGR